MTIEYFRHLELTSEIFSSIGLVTSLYREYTSQNSPKQAKGKEKSIAVFARIVKNLGKIQARLLLICTWILYMSFGQMSVVDIE